MASPTFLKKIAEVALRTLSGFGQDRASMSAAAITYYALISIFPLTLVGLSVAGYIYGGDADQQRLLDDIMEHVPLTEGSGREDLEGVITSIVEARGTLGLVGLISALYTGSALFTTVRVSLNSIFRGEKSRSFFIGKLFDIGMVAVLGSMLLVSIAASFLLTVFSGLVDEFVGSEAATLTNVGVMLLSLLIPPLIATLVFVILYAKIPAAAVQWKHAIPGAILAAVLFEVLKALFGIYAANFTNYDATYGSLGFVILLLAFIYFAAQVVLLGAEAARATEEVVTGWPIPDDQSKVVALRARVTSLRTKALRLLRRDSPPEPTPKLPVSVHGIEPATAFMPEPAEHQTQPGHPTTRKRTSDAPLWGVAGFVGGLLVARWVRHGSKDETPDDRGQA